MTGLGRCDQIRHALLRGEFVFLAITQNSVRLWKARRLVLQDMIFGACGSFAASIDLRCVTLLTLRERFLVAT